MHVLEVSYYFKNTPSITSTININIPWKILDSSKLKELADENVKFGENCRKFLKQVENTVGKGEIARHEQFLLFPQCFQKACAVYT